MIALDPNETFEVVLDSDAGKASPPTFVFRYRSARDWRAAFRLAEQNENESATDRFDRLCACVREALVGWRDVIDNRVGIGAQAVHIEYDPAQLDALLTVGELWELYQKSLRQARMSDDEKKVSGSPSPTPTG